jgi:threonine synthase
MRAIQWPWWPKNLGIEMSIWRWNHQWAPKLAEANRLSLGEGATPLVRSRSIGPAAGLQNLFFKLESANPSGSYKDRFAALAVAHMLEQGQHTCVATSSGNTGAALAAYCAAAGIRCRIAVVESAPMGKLQQMLAYGAVIQRVRGFGLDSEITRQTFERLRARGDEPGCALQISAYAYSPLGMQGVESIGFELVEQLPEMQQVFSPAGGGGLTLAVARGLRKQGHEAAVHCVQPEGNDTIAGPLRAGEVEAVAVECQTAISGLQVASVIDGNEVIAACLASGGTGHTVTDAEVWALQARLAREEGLFAEPAGLVALAGALRAVSAGEIDPEATVVCLVTGSGFKDMASVERLNAGFESGCVEWDTL